MNNKKNYVHPEFLERCRITALLSPQNYYNCELIIYYSLNNKIQNDELFIYQTTSAVSTVLIERHLTAKMKYCEPKCQGPNTDN